MTVTEKMWKTMCKTPLGRVEFLYLLYLENQVKEQSDIGDIEFGKIIGVTNIGVNKAIRQLRKKKLVERLPGAKAHGRLVQLTLPE